MMMFFDPFANLYVFQDCPQSVRYKKQANNFQMIRKEIITEEKVHIFIDW